MLIRPCRIAPCGVYYSIDGIVADEVPRIDRIAKLIADQEFRIDRADSGVPARGAGSEQLLIEVDTFVVFCGRTGRVFSRRARAARQSVTGRELWWIERAVVSHVVVNSHCAWRCAAHDRHQ